MRCEERGRVQVKGIAEPVATYAVMDCAGFRKGRVQRHLKLELQVDRMSGDERKAAADALRRALGLLENDKSRLRLIGSSDVRFWHKADMPFCTANIRLLPNRTLN